MDTMLTTMERRAERDRIIAARLREDRGSGQVDVAAGTESRRIEAACAAFCESARQTSPWPWHEADFGYDAITAAEFRTAMAEALKAASRTGRTE